MQNMVRRFDQPDMTMETVNGNGRCQRLEFGNFALGSVIMQPGFRWSNDIKTLAGAEQWVTADLCEMAHVGAVLEGTYHFALADGRSFDVGAGEVYDIPAGLPHDEWVVGDDPCRVIDVYPATISATPR